MGNVKFMKSCFWGDTREVSIPERTHFYGDASLTQALIRRDHNEIKLNEKLMKSLSEKLI